MEKIPTGCQALSEGAFRLVDGGVKARLIITPVSGYVLLLRYRLEGGIEMAAFCVVKSTLRHTVDPYGGVLYWKWISGRDDMRRLVDDASKNAAFRVWPMAPKTLQGESK